MKILIFIIFIALSSATLNKIFKPKKLYKKLVAPLFGIALKQYKTPDNYDSLEYLEEDHDHVKQSKHHHKKHKEIVIHHHVPHYHHMESFIHGEPMVYSSHQPFHYGHQPFYSGHGHVHVHSAHREPLSEGGLYGGTIGFHDDVIAHGSGPYYQGSGTFGLDDSLQHKDGFMNEFKYY